jgi:hypothetical protein
VFNAASLLLSCPHGTSPFKKRDELFFVDYGIMPLFVHQNYPRSVQSGNHKKDDVASILSQCADLVSDTDLYDTYIRQKGRWDLLTKQAATVSGVGMLSRGRTQPQFPETLGKMSSMKRKHRLLHELIVHTGGRTQVSCSAVFAFLCRSLYLFSRFAHPMFPYNFLSPLSSGQPPEHATRLCAPAA